MPLHRLDGPNGIVESYSEASFPLSVAEDILRHRMEREEPVNRNLILRMLYRKILAEGSPDQAACLRREILSDPAAPLTEADLTHIENLQAMLVPQGWHAHHQKDYATAIDIAEKLLRHDPQSRQALALLTSSLVRCGDMDAAERAVERLLQLGLPIHIEAVPGRDAVKSRPARRGGSGRTQRTRRGTTA